MDTTVTDGMTAVLKCEVSGAPKPAITWKRGRLLCSFVAGVENTGILAVFFLLTHLLSEDQMALIECFHQGLDARVQHE